MVENNEIKCCERPLEFSLVKNSYWEDGRNEANCGVCGSNYIRNNLGKIVYKKVGDIYKCTSCDGIVISTIITHKILDSHSIIANTKEVEYEDVLYCPRCEKKPKLEGTSVVEDLVREIFFSIKSSVQR